MAVTRWVVRALAHTRFVTTPLYRLVLVAALFSALLQLVYGAPNSVVATSGGGWFEWVFVAFQIVGSTAALGGLYLVEGESPWSINPSPPVVPDPPRLQVSLTLELWGLICLQTVMAIQIAASTFYQGRVPSSLALWLVIVFWVWSLFRSRDIIRALRRLTRS